MYSVGSSCLEQCMRKRIEHHSLHGKTSYFVEEAGALATFYILDSLQPHSEH